MYRTHISGLYHLIKALPVVTVWSSSDRKLFIIADKARARGKYVKRVSVWWKTKSWSWRMCSWPRSTENRRNKKNQGLLFSLCWRWGGKNRKLASEVDRSIDNRIHKQIHIQAALISRIWGKLSSASLFTFQEYAGAAAALWRRTLDPLSIFCTPARLKSHRPSQVETFCRGNSRAWNVFLGIRNLRRFLGSMIVSLVRRSNKYLYRMPAAFCVRIWMTLNSSNL